MYLFIRHAEKTHRNGHPNQEGEYGFDPNITVDGMIRSRHIGQKLIKKYGKPTRVVLSPYLRTRQTAFAMLSSLPRGQWPPIEVNKDISEYLGNHHNKEIDLDPQTKYYHPPRDESFDDLRRRIKKFVSNLHPIQGECVWFITHGLVIKLVNEIMGNNHSIKRVGYLEGLVIENENIYKTQDNNENIYTKILYTHTNGEQTKY
jgi:broad specificity phosphatase PhoE